MSATDIPLGLFDFFFESDKYKQQNELIKREPRYKGERTMDEFICRSVGFDSDWLIGLVETFTKHFFVFF